MILSPHRCQTLVRTKYSIRLLRNSLGGETLCGNKGERNDEDITNAWTLPSQRIPAMMNAFAMWFVIGDDRSAA